MKPLSTKIKESTILLLAGLVALFINSFRLLELFGLVTRATPTAIANMEAVTKKFGASPQAFIIIPLIGAFFIDICNAVIIKLMINFIG